MPSAFLRAFFAYSRLYKKGTTLTCSFFSCYVEQLQMFCCKVVIQVILHFNYPWGMVDECGAVFILLYLRWLIYFCQIAFIVKVVQGIFFAESASESIRAHVDNAGLWWGDQLIRRWRWDEKLFKSVFSFVFDINMVETVDRYRIQSRLVAVISVSIKTYSISKWQRKSNIPDGLVVLICCEEIKISWLSKNIQ